MIAARQLTKFYGDTRAVHDLSFDIEKGEIVGVLGLNGAGKSTILRILSCLLLPSSGSVTVDGADVVDDPEGIRRKVGFLPEVPPLYEEMEVHEYLRFSGKLRGMSNKQVEDRLKEVAQLTDITSMLNEIIGNLSHGYRKRVGIAQAIIHQPPLVILDEPISGLDPVQIVEMRSLVRNLGGKHTVLVSSHILSEISQTCDRILMLKDGEMVASGTEQEITERFRKGHAIQLAIRGDKDKAQSIVTALEHVTACEPSHSEGAVHHFRVRTSQDAREALAKALVSADIGLLELSEAGGELESVFLQLTQSSKASH